MMIDSVPAFIPQIADLLEGLNWDLMHKARTRYENESSDHPIEDPVNSFTHDHNRERMTRLDLSLTVSAHPISGDQADDGPQRISSLMSSLLAIRSQQAVSPSAYFSVVTGLKTHNNMQIRSIRDMRRRETPSELMIELSLEEKRFSTSPRLSPVIGLLDASDGPVDQLNETLVTLEDQMLVEQIYFTRRPRVSSLPQAEFIIPPFAQDAN